MNDIDSILVGKYPAKAHAAKVADYLQKHHGITKGIIHLEGQKTRMIEDNDEPMPFRTSRQRRHFFYLSGCNLPDSYLTYDISSKQLTLFIPPIDSDLVVWSGLPLSPSEALNLYDVDDVKFTSEINIHHADLPNPANAKNILIIPGQVSDQICFDSYETKNFDVLKIAIEESRVTKTLYEIALIRRANAISAIAHTAVLRAVKHALNERELEAIFLERCIAYGCREQAYHSIVASGTAAATLHYQKNAASLAGKRNLLLDAGAEERCYASDITRTFPISGTFDVESRQIYDLVLRMQTTCTAMIRAGVLWDDVHACAHEVAIEGLLHIGILKGASMREIFEARTSVAFFPHGLGHYLGMDTHDTGGHADYADKDSMYRYLRVRGRLPAGSVITVEPGVYFCRFIVEPYLDDPVHGKYINRKVLERYWEVGGVRLEDNILITDDGYENLTTALKDVDDLEKIINT